jgi:hypothetical protein
LPSGVDKKIYQRTRHSTFSLYINQHVLRRQNQRCFPIDDRIIE